MSSVGSSMNTAEAAASPDVRSLMSLYGELTKVRLSTLVVLTAAVGYVMGSPAGYMSWPGLLWCVLGTGLAAAAASVFNQIIETDRDGRMHRTKDRPLPSGAMSRAHALVTGAVMTFAGLMVLAVGVNLAASALALVTILLYALVYTPMKVLTTTNTLVGAIVGALPPMIGWVGATGTMTEGGWILAAILFVWQIPHFLALAWMYREDYARGSYRMLPNLDPDGSLTGRVILLTSLLLVPLGLTATLVGLSGWVFALGATILGLWASRLGWQFLCERSDRNARRVFLASIVYLPLLLILLVCDRGGLGGKTVIWPSDAQQSSSNAVTR